MKKANYDFIFSLSDIDESTKVKAKLRLAELLAIAPPGAKALGLIEKRDNLYVSGIEISSPYQTFYHEATGFDPDSTLRRVLERIEDSIFRWRHSGGGQGSQKESKHQQSRLVLQNPFQEKMKTLNH